MNDHYGEYFSMDGGIQFQLAENNPKGVLSGE